MYQDRKLLTEKWFEEVAWKRVNQFLCEYAGKRIGSVPFGNLDLDIPPEIDMDQLEMILKRNGVKAMIWNFGENDFDVLIKVD